MTGMELLQEKQKGNGYTAGKIQANINLIADVVTILSSEQRKAGRRL